MDWIQFFGFMFTIAGLFFWNRSEANSDRRDMLNLIKSIEHEMKDFHGRLCAIEERNREKR
jgi:hypothetical protein